MRGGPHVQSKNGLNVSYHIQLHPSTHLDPVVYRFDLAVLRVHVRPDEIQQPALRVVQARAEARSVQQRVGDLFPAARCKDAQAGDEAHICRRDGLNVSFERELDRRELTKPSHSPRPPSSRTRPISLPASAYDPLPNAITP